MSTKIGGQFDAGAIGIINATSANATGLNIGNDAHADITSASTCAGRARKPGLHDTSAERRLK